MQRTQYFAAPRDGQAERLATGADPEASSLHARLQSAWEAPLLADTERAIASLRREAEATIAALMPELAHAGLHVAPVSACGTLWSVHCTINASRVYPTLTLYQLQQALAARRWLQRPGEE